MVLVLVVLLAGISVTISGCKWPWEKDPTSPSTINITGRWVLTVTSSYDGCGDPLPVGSTLTVTFSQNGSSLTAIFEDGDPISGTIDTVSGAFALYGEETTLTGTTNGRTLTATFTFDYDDCDGGGSLTGNKQ